MTTEMNSFDDSRRRPLPSAGTSMPTPTVSTSLTGEQLIALTATEAVQAIASGEVSAVAYLTALLDRASQLEDLRGIVTLNREGAIAAAAAVDSARASGSTLGALAGLPIIVKDNFNTKNLPTTGGTPALEHFQPSADAALLGPLLAAGAIIIGKANMTELAFGVTTTNVSPFAGIAKNPYDQSRIPGGSSGGSGVTISTRIAPAGLGTDTGGSVRIPAAFCGIAGLRPSTGGAQKRYDASGILPISHTLDTPGPMGRTVADVALLDAVITSTPIATPATLSELRIGIPAVFWGGLEAEVDAAAQQARQRLAAAGVAFVEVDMPEAITLSEATIFPVALHEPIQDIPEYLADSGATGITLEQIADQIASPDVKKAFGEVMTDAQAAAYPDAVNVSRPRLQQIYADYFTTNKVGAIMFPTSPVLPAPIDLVNGSSTISIDGGPAVDTFSTTIRNTGPGSCAGVPSLSIPAGLSSSGIPVGITIEGPLDGDTTLLGIGMAIERVLGSVPAPEV